MDNEFKYKFDRLQWLKSKKFLSRTSIFLDLRFWIGMIEQRDENHIKLKDLLSTMVMDQQVICPVSPTLLLELKKQPASEKRTKCCQLMDELSNGLSIRTWPVIFKDEFKANIEERSIEKSFGYSHYIDAFSAGIRLAIDKTLPIDETIKTGDLIFSDMVKKPISELVDIKIDDDKLGSIVYLRNGLSTLAKREETWKASHPVNWQNIEQVEFKATLRAMLPEILSTTTEISVSRLEFQTTTSDKEKLRLLNNCPTFWCHYQLMTALRSNRLRLKENDLWDIEHAASAIPYVECFAGDAGTRHICSEVLKFDDKYKTVIISNVADLITWLETI